MEAAKCKIYQSFDVKYSKNSHFQRNRSYYPWVECDLSGGEKWWGKCKKFIFPVEVGMWSTVNREVQ